MCLLEQNNYVTAKTISKEFNVTPKTIYIDINILQQELAEYGLIVDKKTNCGILLVGTDEAKKRLVQLSILVTMILMIKV